MFSPRVQTIVALPSSASLQHSRHHKVAFLSRPKASGSRAERQTLVKASPSTGTHGVEMFRDTMLAGTSTGLHLHQQADEFFYVISGQGLARVEGPNRRSYGQCRLRATRA
jgi:quercetin dioxygenase-like cupin family protein